MTIEVAIQDALFGRLKTANLIDQIAWPDVEYVPTNGVTYLEVHKIMRAAPQDLSINFGGSTVLRGIFQVDVVYPDNAGPTPGLTLAEQLRALFDKGTQMTAGGRRLQIVKRPAIANDTEADAPWVRLPVSIAYELVTTN